MLELRKVFSRVMHWLPDGETFGLLDELCFHLQILLTNRIGNLPTNTGDNPADVHHYYRQSSAEDI